MKVLRLKKWVEIVLMVLTIPMCLMMMYNIELNWVITVSGFIGFNVLVAIIVEYGTLFDKLIVKIEKFNNK